MFNRSPYGAYQIAEGVDGALMGRTLGYLALLLAILAVAAGISPAFGGWSLWLGIIGAFLGTIMVSRNIASAGRALTWGTIVAIGMGLLIGPVVWTVALTQPTLLWSTLGTLVIAVLFSALLVSWIPWDFTRLMPLLFLGLIMLLVTSLLSWIIPGMTGVVMSRAYNLIGVLIFIGYLIVDFSIMRFRGRVIPLEGAPVVLAVSILVDIVNLFLFLLRLGRR